MDAVCNDEKGQFCYTLSISYLHRTKLYPSLGLCFSAFHRSASILSRGSTTLSRGSTPILRRFLVVPRGSGKGFLTIPLPDFLTIPLPKHLKRAKTLFI